METVWIFRTKRFCVALQMEQDYNYRYDGDDEDGEIQRKLDNGDYIAFDSRVVVYFKDMEVGRDSLGGSVYDWRNRQDFWTAHRNPDPMSRNCSIMRATTGRAYGHYFPGMVTEAIAEARKLLCATPRMRCA